MCVLTRQVNEYSFTCKLLLIVVSSQTRTMDKAGRLLSWLTTAGLDMLNMCVIYVRTRKDIDEE